MLIGLALLMLVLASSMFGAWEFRVPQFIANRSGGRAGVAGALTMGLFVGIVAAPCVGPFVVALFTLVAAIGKPVIGMAMFATLAFGLGFPYLVALNALPKPGEWMVQVKKAMGFVLVAMAVLLPRVRSSARRRSAGASRRACSSAPCSSSSAAATRGRVMRIACAIAAADLRRRVRHPAAQGRRGVVAEVRRGAAVDAGKPVIIDFYADVVHSV